MFEVRWLTGTYHTAYSPYNEICIYNGVSVLTGTSVAPRTVTGCECTVPAQSR